MSKCYSWCEACAAAREEEEWEERLDRLVSPWARGPRSSMVMRARLPPRGEPSRVISVKCECLSPTTWAVGVACGQWFAKPVTAEDKNNRFALIEVD